MIQCIHTLFDKIPWNLSTRVIFYKLLLTYTSKIIILFTTICLLYSYLGTEFFWEGQIISWWYVLSQHLPCGHIQFHSLEITTTTYHWRNRHPSLISNLIATYSLQHPTYCCLVCHRHTSVVCNPSIPSILTLFSN